jgi:hypothetical protein
MRAVDVDYKRDEDRDELFSVKVFCVPERSMMT